MTEAVEKSLNQLKQEMKESEMEATEITTPSKPAAKKVVVKKGIGAVKTTAKPAAEKAPKPAAKKTAKPAAPKKAAKDDGSINLKRLCQELKLKPHLARRKLRAANLHAEGRYAWADGSKDLTKVREILSA